MRLPELLGAAQDPGFQFGLIGADRLHEAGVIQGPVDNHFHLREAEGFLDQVIGAALQGLDAGVQGGEGGDQDAEDIGLPLLDGGDEFQAREPTGHMQIREHHGEGCLGHPVQGCFAAGDGLGGVTLALQGLEQRGAQLGFIIHDEDGFLDHGATLAGTVRSKIRASMKMRSTSASSRFTLASWSRISRLRSTLTAAL